MRPSVAAPLAAAAAVFFTPPLFAASGSAAPGSAASGSAVDGRREAKPLADEAVAFSEELVFDTGRRPFGPPRGGLLSLRVRGEYQMRYRALTDLPLEPPITDASQSRLGQNQYLYHWLRASGRFDFQRRLALAFQIDAPRGLVVGDPTRGVEAARDALAAQNGFEVHPRYLYLEYDSPVGVFRLGQQGVHWGMGIVANDGDHPSLFGDYLRGVLAERLLYTTAPFGRRVPLSLLLAVDLVFHDQFADLTRGDQALQGVLGLSYRTTYAELGFNGALRHQTRGARATGPLTPFVEALDAAVLDVSGAFHAPVPGAQAFLYGRFEAAMIVGSTSYLRNTYAEPIDPRAPRENESIRALGGAATVGVVHVAVQGQERWGDLVGELEVGYASGDADPYDGIDKRFTFEPNHNVGLVLFDQVLAWKTARAATIAGDRALVARRAPGLDLFPSQGGIFGAQYLNPRVVFRPKRFVDLKAGVVIAQTTADLVDPYQAAVLGNLRNYDGGDPRHHDLGIELDVGADLRIPVEEAAIVQFGADVGVFFPGRAFDDALGNRLPPQTLANVKLGVQF